MMRLETAVVSKKIEQRCTPLGDVDEHHRYQELNDVAGVDDDVEQQKRLQNIGEVHGMGSYYDSITSPANETVSTGEVSGATPTTSSSNGGLGAGDKHGSYCSFLNDGADNDQDQDVFEDLNDTKTTAMYSTGKPSYILNNELNGTTEKVKNNTIKGAFRSSSSSSEGRFLASSRLSSTTRQSQLRSISDSGLFDNALHMNLDGTNTTSSSSSTATTKKQLASLVQKESNWLSKTRMLMMLVLLVVTAVCATITYYVVCKIERNSFTTRYEDFAKEILTVSTQINSINIRNIYELMSLQLTAYTISPSSGVWAGRSDGNDNFSKNSRNWPFVQIPEWDSLSSKILNTTGANFVAFTPLVSHENRISYETYTLLNQVERGNGGNNNLPFIYHHTESQEYGMENVNSDNDTTATTLSSRPAAPADLYAPIAHIAPDKYHSHLNHDKLDVSHFDEAFEAMVESKRPTLSRFIDYNDGDLQQTQPTSLLVAPIYQRPMSDETPNPELVGVISAEIPWRVFFSNLIPHGVDGIALVVENSCNQSATYIVNGPNVEFWGNGDLHNREYDEHEVSGNFNAAFASTVECDSFSVHLYPSDEIVNAYQTNSPKVYTIIVVFIFVGVSLLFILYDHLVEKRQEKIMSSAVRSSALINSLFPANVRERLMDDAVQQQQRQESQELGEQANSLQQQQLPQQEEQNQNQAAVVSRSPMGQRTKMRRRLSGDFGDILRPISMILPMNQAAVSPACNQESDSNKSLKIYDSKPIADFFPNCSVLFADLVGFTAWSSARSPSQVFVLLETLYNSFDAVARKLGVFKVETIGDCYLAACGLPEPRDDHAVVLVKFARRCMYQLQFVVAELERMLGPGTNELAIRIGIHSGPVTAGVLRGEKSRFQLFGDTVNTAARMESTGEPERVQMSQKTAELLIAAGKSHWIKARSDLVSAKGKGELQTYWMVSKSEKRRNSTNAPSSSEDSLVSGLNSLDRMSLHQSRPVDSNQEAYEIERLVTWNVDVFKKLLIKILATRVSGHDKESESFAMNGSISKLTCSTSTKDGSTVLDEVREFITLPDNSNFLPNNVSADSTSHIDLDPNALEQLTEFVEAIAGNYNTNSFHSYRHACHVLQSVTKLLSRVDASIEVTGGIAQAAMNNDGNKMMSPFTYWLASDPLVQFACAFAAIIHDVDHRGVSNVQLVKEQSELAIKYKNKSVAEQNSVDLAWGLLMESRFEHLRACIYTTQEELERFRQLVVNTVMATDVMDKELNQLRRKRWETAFPSATAAINENMITNEQQQIQTNRKATIVIEHLLQASDIAHTMQHWHIYIKWNQRLFHEMYEAYLSGKAEIDPSLDWFKNELGFFDFYVIPLATKLNECAAFGVTSEEYLMYAILNRREFELKGKEIVANYLSVYDADDDDDDDDSNNSFEGDDDEEICTGGDDDANGDDDDDSAIIDV